MLDAKTRKLKGLRKESGKVRIKLLSFFHLGRDRIILGASGKARVVREWKRGDRRLIARDCSEQAVHFHWKLGNAPPKPREDHGSLTQVIRKRLNRGISPLLSRAEVAQW